MRRREVPSTGSKASSNSSDSDSGDEQEYNKFYASVGKTRSRINDKAEEEKYMRKHPFLGTTDKAATIGYLPRRKEEIPWRPNLKPVKQRNSSSGDAFGNGNDHTKVFESLRCDLVARRRLENPVMPLILARLFPFLHLKYIALT